jgi:hypothetical protein
MINITGHYDPSIYFNGDYVISTQYYDSSDDHETIELPTEYPAGEFKYSLAMSNRITYVPVEWILQNLTESVDIEDPDELIVDIVTTKVRNCAAVICNIEKYGFICPIVIQTDSVGSCFIMGNGHHRLTSAIFMFLEYVPVYFSTTEDYMCLNYSTGGELDHSLEDIPYIGELLEDIYADYYVTDE